MPGAASWALPACWVGRVAAAQLELAASHRSRTRALWSPSKLLQSHQTIKPASAPTHLDAQLAAQGKGGEGVGVDASLIQVAHIELHAAVVLGGDQLVGPGAAQQAGRCGEEAGQMGE